MGHVRFAVLLATAAVAATMPAAVRAETYHTCAGFIDSVPATISTQGVWCLRQDLATTITTGAAITVAANNVTVDCNGFKVGGLGAGDASQASGIFAQAVQNATVRNCNIRGFARGVHLDQGEGHLIEGNRLDNSLYLGISVCCGSNNIVQRNTVYDTGGSTIFNPAIAISAQGSIRGNTVRSVNAQGSGTARGISTTSIGTAVSDNEIYEVVSDAAGSSTAVGIYANGLAQTIEGNIVIGLYAAPDGAAIGIHAAADDAQVVGNRLSAVSDGIYGIRGSNSNTVCKDNSAVGFTTAFSSCEALEGNVSPP